MPRIINKEISIVQKIDGYECDYCHKFIEDDDTKVFRIAHGTCFEYVFCLGDAKTFDKYGFGCLFNYLVKKDGRR